MRVFAQTFSIFVLHQRRSWRYKFSIMARRFARRCPKCREHFFGVVINDPTPQSREIPITAYCAVCGYQRRSWRLILGRKREPEVRYDRMPKVFL